MIARFLLRHLLSFVLICAVLLLGRWGWAEWQAYQSSRAEIGQLAGPTSASRAMQAPLPPPARSAWPGYRPHR